ncbi:hypothetical protein [Gracilibacillus xinjiangensis]|uniref:Uncharacterized protein n=1 Tax=Gracilibacillus xinjiangensis TaxID=1193282 RepID=A0ABV8WRH3_9BACI
MEQRFCYKVHTTPEGITIFHQGMEQFFGWEQVKQYGTLAVVLSENDEDKWAIGLGKRHQVESAGKEQKKSKIVLYKAELEQAEEIHLQYQGEAY